MRIEFDPAKRQAILTTRGLDMTPRGATRRIISMRKANGKEQALYGPRLR